MTTALSDAVTAQKSEEAPLLVLNTQQGETSTAETPAVDNGETETEEDYAINAGSATLTINGVAHRGIRVY